MKRNARNTFGYKARMWFYRLTKDDFYKFVNETFDGIPDTVLRPSWY